MEKMNKYAYIGLDSVDQAFKSWLTIYSHIPEGVALIRNNEVLYANRSLYHLLDINSGLPGQRGSLTEN